MSEPNTLNKKEQWKQRAQTLKLDVVALYFAYRDPRVTWYAKLFIIFVVGYAFSPIDLIPDFIPILGYLDDLVLIPIGISLAIKMIPSKVMDDARAKSLSFTAKPTNWFAGIIIICLWLLGLFWVLSLVLE